MAVTNIAKKAKGISPSATLAIDAKFKSMIAEGKDVVGFGTGEPDFDTPQYIKDAAIKAIMDGKTKYTPAAGTLELKKAVCAKFKKDNGLDYEPSQIVVSNGAKHSLVNVFMAICDPGDEVIIPAPYWVSYPEMVKLADGVPVILNTTEENGFKFTTAELRSAITDKTRAVVINSPSNPTGMLYSEEELREIAALAVEKNIYVISDEIYEHLIYNGKHVSVASFNEDIKRLTIIVNGVSKTYAMTGWRIGYTASDKAIAAVMSNIQSHATSNPNTIAQSAAVAALCSDGNDIEVMRNEFENRKNYMVERINGMEGVSCLNPDGAFYVFMNIERLIGKSVGGKRIDSSDDFADAFLELGNVAVVPGSGFGADRYVRWSYATGMDSITEGLNRLEDFLKTIK